jgi:hypothetical protein
MQLNGTPPITPPVLPPPQFLRALWCFSLLRNLCFLAIGEKDQNIGIPEAFGAAHPPHIPHPLASDKFLTPQYPCRP